MGDLLHVKAVLMTTYITSAIYKNIYPLSPQFLPREVTRGLLIAGYASFQVVIPDEGNLKSSNRDSG